MASVRSLIKRFETLSESLEAEQKLGSKNRALVSQSIPLQTFSDGNCIKSCGLQYGISEEFNHKLRDQMTIISSQSFVPPQIFDDPK